MKSSMWELERPAYWNCIIRAVSQPVRRRASRSGWLRSASSSESDISMSVKFCSMPRVVRVLATHFCQVFIEGDNVITAYLDNGGSLENAQAMAPTRVPTPPSSTIVRTTRPPSMRSRRLGFRRWNHSCR